MKLKVCGMRELSNIKRLVADIKPDYLGLIFYEKSPRFIGNYLSPEQIPLSNTIRVGVFVNAPAKEIIQKVEIFGLGAVQLHGNETPIFCQELRNRFSEKGLSVSIIKAFQIGNLMPHKKLEAYHFCDYFLLDTQTPQFGGSGKRFSWNLLDDYQLDIPFFLSGGICLEHAQEISEIRNSKLFGIDVNSGFEVCAAYKNIEQLQRFKKLLF